MLELETRADFDRWLTAADRPAAAVQAVDLADLTAPALAGDFEGTIFLGCKLADKHVAAHLVERGAVVLPPFADFAFEVHRARLYTPEELFAGFDPGDPDSHTKTFDHRVFEEFIAHGRDAPASIRTSLARRLHDHSITDALEETIAGRKVVAIMGGHSMARRDPDYAKVARISRALTRLGFLMVSGGGPGAMEATHLGAWFAARPDADLDGALRTLGVRPQNAEGGEYSDPDWLHRAMAVRAAYPIPEGREADCLSVGIPTWLYGHEPPAAFATRIAKYFANSVREDGLLAIAKHGVIFAPGSAGTTQEIFQDACQNHYGTAGAYSPMIGLGVDHWTRVRPVWPLLEAVARDRVYGELLFLTDDEDAVVRKIRSYDLELYRKADG